MKTVLASSSVDPHDYEPTPADAASFEGAQLVVVNGAHYDEWAAKLAATSAPNATVASAATDDDAQNPHVWYDPAAVTGLADRLTAELSKLAPDAAGYFADRRSAFADAMKPYDSAINATQGGRGGQDLRSHRGRVRRHGRRAWVCRTGHRRATRRPRATRPTRRRPTSTRS